MSEMPTWSDLDTQTSTHSNTWQPWLSPVGSDTSCDELIDVVNSPLPTSDYCSELLNNSDDLFNISVDSLETFLTSSTLPPSEKSESFSPQAPEISSDDNPPSASITADPQRKPVSPSQTSALPTTSLPIFAQADTVTSHPLYPDLRQTLHTECQTTAPPIALLNATAPPSDSYDIPISMRFSSLQRRFSSLSMTTQQVASQQLYAFFCQEWIAIRKEHLHWQQMMYGNPLMCEPVNAIFDQRRRGLISRIEQSLSILESLTVPARLPPPECQATDTVPSSQSILTQHRSALTTTNSTAMLSLARKSVNVTRTPCNVADKENEPARSSVTTKTQFIPLNPLATQIMKRWYEDHIAHPYPNTEDITAMAEAGRVTASQVRKWFANQRLRRRNTRSMREIAQQRRVSKLHKFATSLRL